MVTLFKTLGCFYMQYLTIFQISLKLIVLCSYNVLLLSFKGCWKRLVQADLSHLVQRHALIISVKQDYMPCQLMSNDKSQQLLFVRIQPQFLNIKWLEHQQLELRENLFALSVRPSMWPHACHWQNVQAFLALQAQREGEKQKHNAPTVLTSGCHSTASTRQPADSTWLAIALIG